MRQLEQSDGQDALRQNRADLGIAEESRFQGLGIRRMQMGSSEKRSGNERRGKKERRSGNDTRSDEEKRLIGERRANTDRRSGIDRRSDAKKTDKPKND